jgi:hypothetical protein
MTEPVPARPGGLPWLDLTLLLALISALLVTAGWAYAETWYGQFDLGLMGLEVPPVYFAIYGFKTLKSDWWWLLPLTLAALFAWHLYAGRLPRWSWIALPPAVLLLFWAAHGLGYAAARLDYSAHARSGFCAPSCGSHWTGSSLCPTRSSRPRPRWPGRSCGSWSRRRTCWY